VNEVQPPGVVDVQGATLDNPGAVPPAAQLQVAERLSWMRGAQQLPELERYPPTELIVLPMQTMTQHTAKATRREWIGLAVIALPCMLYSMDLTVLNLAVPQLTADLKPTAAQLLWIIDIYGFMVAGFLMTMGTLGDRIGRRRLLLIGAAAFGAASVLAAFSTSAEMLIFSRAVLGLAGATLAPSTLSLITNMFPDPQERTFAIGMWISSFSVGAIVGPFVGGLLIEYFWWGSVFLAGVPVMVLLLVLGPLLLPEYKDPLARRIDLVSAGLSLAAVLTFIYGVKRMSEAGIGWMALAALAAGIGLAAAFVARQRRLAEPFVDLDLFQKPEFGTALAINVVGMFFMFGAFVYLAQYYQLVAGLSPLRAGLASIPAAIAFTVASTATPALIARTHPAKLMATGMILSSAGFVMLVLADGILGVILASIVLSVGFTPVVTLTTGMIVGAAPPERSGNASAISETGAELGGALGIALLGSIGTVIYRAQMDGRLTDVLSSEAERSAWATLGGAIEAAARLSEPAASELVRLGRAAFMTGLDVTALLAAVVLAGSAIVVARVLAHVQSPAGGGH
jgi:DHA2 family multidrug resistance protein-like MFS transporter